MKTTKKSAETESFIPERTACARPYPETPPLLAVIGAGGKTTAMEEIASAGAGRGLSVLFTTTTHIYPLLPPKSRELLVDPEPEILLLALSRPGVVCAGNAAAGTGKKTGGEKAAKAGSETDDLETDGSGTDDAESEACGWENGSEKGTAHSAQAARKSAAPSAPEKGSKTAAAHRTQAAPETPAADIPKKLSPLKPQLFRSASALAGLTVCEADGSRHLPLKLHREGEPALPASASHCLIVAGLSALGKPVSACVHRYELNPLWNEHPETVIGAEQLCFCVMDAVTTVRAASLPLRSGIKILLNQSDVLQTSGGEEPCKEARAAGSRARKRKEAAAAASFLRSLGFDVRIGSLKKDASFLWKWLFS